MEKDDFDDEEENREGKEKEIEGKAGNSSGMDDVSQSICSEGEVEDAH